MSLLNASMFAKSRSQDAEVRAFEDEALPHVNALYGMAMRYTRSPDDASDLVQETMLKAYKAFEQFEKGTNCKAWLFRIMTNTYINKYRRRVKERDILEGTQRLAAEHQIVHLPSKRATLDPENDIADKTLSDEVQAALAKVPEDFRSVVMLSDIEGFSYKEIADIVQIPVGTVMSRLFRGRRILQQQLFDYAVDAGVLHPARDGGESGPMTLDDYRARRARKEKEAAAA